MIDRMFIQEEKTTLALDKQLAKEKPGNEGAGSRVPAASSGAARSLTPPLGGARAPPSCLVESPERGSPLPAPRAHFAPSILALQGGNILPPPGAQKSGKAEPGLG